MSDITQETNGTGDVLADEQSEVSGPDTTDQSGTTDNAQELDSPGEVTDPAAELDDARHIDSDVNAMQDNPLGAPGDLSGDDVPDTGDDLSPPEMGDTHAEPDERLSLEETTPTLERRVPAGTAPAQ